MLFATVGQGSVFIWMTAAGFLMGVLYDMFRLLRCMFGSGAWASLLLDAAWGACAGGVFCGMLIYANYGVLRGYTLAAAALGMLLYGAAISVPMEALLRAVGVRLCRVLTHLSQFRLVKAVFR